MQALTPVERQAREMVRALVKIMAARYEQLLRPRKRREAKG